MSKRCQTIASVGISLAIAAVLWSAPASANGARKATATGDVRSERVAPSSAKRMATHARSKPRLVRSHWARVASLYPTGDRQFPLIIGIGF